GDFVVSSAGHPPAAHFDSGSGTWRLTTARGIVLGVVANLRLVPEHGTLRPGDALMLYTDGLVEVPGKDIDDGTDRLLGEADRLVTTGFRAGAADLVRALSTGAGTSAGGALALIGRPGPAAAPGAGPLPGGRGGGGAAGARGRPPRPGSGAGGPPRPRGGPGGRVGCPTARPGGPSRSRPGCARR